MKKRVLWILNIMPPTIATILNIDSSNKEGWIDGILQTFLESEDMEQIQLGIAAPCLNIQIPMTESVTINEDYDILAYQFRENSILAHEYSLETEGDLSNIMQSFKPDMIHCFGTEYPHTLAAIKSFARPDRTLIGIQGLCSVYANGYMASLPYSIRKKLTFRDVVKKDTLQLQQQKFVDRGNWEILAIKAVKHVTGRTSWDEFYTKKWNNSIQYHKMNETLRSVFYLSRWEFENCKSHSIFMSQGDYPIKGLHYMLLSLKDILCQYPDTRLYVAGNSIMRGRGIKAKLKISAYGEYIQKILRDHDLEERVTFLGKLNMNEMLEQYLKSHLFVCPSTMENSPNSLGEAMLLGMPIVTSNVGGITSMIDENECYMYQGFQAEFAEQEEELTNITKNLTYAILDAFSHQAESVQRGMKARAHALITHSKEINFSRLIEIYNSIC